MRRPPVLLALVALALAAAACTSTAGPGWTYAAPTEAPSATPVASGDASAAPSAAPSGSPSASESPSGGGGGTVVQISALNIAFEQTAVSAPADVPFTIHFSNKDASIPHDVVIKDGAGMEMFRGALTTGPQEIDYQVPALPAGAYTFICSVHPNMTGTLTVGG